jgi:hypothetical protein
LPRGKLRSSLSAPRNLNGVGRKQRGKTLKKRFYTEGAEKKNGESGDSPGKKFKKQKTALIVFADEDGGAEHGGPEAALVADSGLRDVHGADDLVGDAVDLFFLVEAEIRVKFHVQSGR